METSESELHLEDRPLSLQKYVNQWESNQVIFLCL